MDPQPFPFLSRMQTVKEASALCRSFLDGAVIFSWEVHSKYQFVLFIFWAALPIGGGGQVESAPLF